jgi:tRNA pseudouridine32 synthase/23S rRNA pseudouridine746 synthase
MPGLNPTILFENDDFWVIDKPIGWTIQKDEQAPSVLLWLQEKTGLATLPVHRIDKPTSGIVLVAKNNAANRELSMAFESRQVNKTYLAISDQKPKKKQGWVKGDMAPSRRSQFKLLRSLENPAITQFTSMSLGNGCRGYVLKPKTGKTHQIRVAMKSIGSPILGDALYAGTTAERVFLHAWQIEFSLQQQTYQFTAKPSAEWLEHWPETLLPTNTEEQL